MNPLSSLQLEDKAVSKEISVKVKQEDKALWIFGKTNPLRRFSCYIIESRIFKGIIYLLIITSTVNLAMEMPLSDPNSVLNVIITYLDLGITIAFATECALKLVSNGFLLNGSGSYLRNPWNRFDFLIVITSMLSFVSTSNLKLAKLFRVLRIVRPLRLIPKMKGLKTAVKTLAKSIKEIVNITVLVLFFLFMWGTFGVNFFKGLFFDCNTDNLSESTGFDGLVLKMDTKWDCLSSGGEWVKQKNTFDNVFDAAFLLFQISTLQGWVDVMYRTEDARGIDLVSEVGYNKAVSVYFICFILIGGLFVINLFNSVVISTYKKEKEKLTNNSVLSDLQQEWVNIQINCQKAKPKVNEPSVKHSFRKVLIKFTKRSSFEWFIFASTILNTAVLACNFYGMSKTLEDYFNYSNFFFTAVFSLEALIKFVGYGTAYLKQWWNVFDFLILASTGFQVADRLLSLTTGDILYVTVLRILKLLKSARLFKHFKVYKDILKTLIVTLPNLGNIALLLFLLMVFYAITGMIVFGRVMLHDALDNNANFQSFEKAIKTIIRCSTGEGWNNIMVALMDQRSITFQCIDNASYQDIQNNGGMALECGNYWFSLIFFLTFETFVCQIFLNLFIAIILEGFDETKDNLRIDSQMIKSFKEVWAIYDPQGTGFIDVKDLNFMIQILIERKTKWIRGGETLISNETLLLRFQHLLELSLYNNFKHLQFNDVICKLARVAFKIDFQSYLIDQFELNHVESHTSNEESKGKMTSQVDWQKVKGHLEFENYDHFYSDMMEKLNRTHFKIDLNLELKEAISNKEKDLAKAKTGYDIRIFAFLPLIVTQMRKLVARARLNIREAPTHRVQMSKQQIRLLGTISSKVKSNKEQKFFKELAISHRENALKLKEKSAEDQSESMQEFGANMKTLSNLSADRNSQPIRLRRLQQANQQVKDFDEIEERQNWDDLHVGPLTRVMPPLQFSDQYEAMVVKLPNKYGR